MCYAQSLWKLYKLLRFAQLYIYVASWMNSFLFLICKQSFKFKQMKNNKFKNMHTQFNGFTKMTDIFSISLILVIMIVCNLTIFASSEVTIDIPRDNGLRKFCKACSRNNTLRKQIFNLKIFIFVQTKEYLLYLL